LASRVSKVRWKRKSVSFGRLKSEREGVRTGVGVHGTASDKASLDELVGVAAKDLAVLAAGVRCKSGSVSVAGRRSIVLSGRGATRRSEISE
jgi:hypothetical protein